MCCGDRVSGVGLAGLASCPAVGLVDLDDQQAVASQVLEEPGTVGAGAFHPDRDDIPQAPEPGLELAIAGNRCREPLVPEQTAELVECRDRVGVGVGVDAAGDLARRGCGSYHGVAPVCRSDGTGRNSRSGGQHSDEARPSSYQVTHRPAGARPRPTTVQVQGTKPA